MNLKEAGYLSLVALAGAFLYYMSDTTDIVIPTLALLGYVATNPVRR